MIPPRPVPPGQIDLLSDAPANMLLFSAMVEQIKPAHRDFAQFGNGLVTLQIIINGVELPDPLAALEKVAAEWSRQSEAEVSRRALEMVSEAGLNDVHSAFSKLHDTIEAARYELKRVLREKAGAQFYDED